VPVDVSDEVLVGNVVLVDADEVDGDPCAIIKKGEPRGGLLAGSAGDSDWNHTAYFALLASALSGIFMSQLKEPAVVILTSPMYVVVSGLV
jgi:hypothetical protein